MQEIWKDIENYEGCYQVSNLGRVRSLTRKVDTFNGVRTTKGQILKPLRTKVGYFRVDLKQHQKDNYVSIHRLVAKAFIPNPNNYQVINHIDGDTSNNRVDNLEWCTQSYNIKEAYRVGKAKPTSACFKKGSVPPNLRKVNQYSKNNEYINTFKSVKEAALAVNTVRGNISNCLNGYSKTAKGYIWRYAD